MRPNDELAVYDDGGPGATTEVLGAVAKPAQWRPSRGLVIAAAVAAAALAVTGMVLVLPDRAPGPAAATGAATGSASGAPSAGSSGSAAVGAAPAPTASAPAGTLANLALLVDNRLVLGDGSIVDIPRTGNSFVESAYPAVMGWIVTTYDVTENRYTYWLVGRDHAVRPLLKLTSSRAAVAPDGRSVAWTADDHMYAGHLTEAGTLVSDRSTPVPPPGKGAVWLYDGTTVLVGWGAGSGVVAFDPWRPDRGNYVPTWDQTAAVRGIYGSVAGSSMLIGTVAGAQEKELCLALLDPADTLSVVRRRCNLPALSDRYGRVSPDGRWLVAHYAAGQIALYDLARVFTDPTPRTIWNTENPGVWLDATTMVTLNNQGSLVQVHIGSSTMDPVTIPGVPIGRTNRVAFVGVNP